MLSPQQPQTDGPYPKSAGLEKRIQALAVICTVYEISVWINKGRGKGEGGLFGLFSVSSERNCHAWLVSFAVKDH